MSAADLVAVLRAFAVIPIAWLVLTGGNILALAIFIVAALSDAVDGWLARRAGVTARGAFLDPLADKILVVGTLTALAWAGAGWPVTLVAILAAAREGLVLVLRWRALVRGTTLPADAIAKAKTTAEMLGIALILVGGRPWSVLGVGLAGVAVAVGMLRLPRYFAEAGRARLNT
ncbi:MAG TPA: CDP-alcohol phosphatidyltransferase family protein [Candidatus Acidoferrales bacterium]|nr:CDP-alcohol phosphatidyltransferase family protein [Candidatus Acidoferrales bacterium]